MALEDIDDLSEEITEKKEGHIDDHKKIVRGLKSVKNKVQDFLRIEKDQLVPVGYRARPPYNSTGNVIATIQSNGTNLGASFKMMEEAQVSGTGLTAEFALYLNNSGEAENGSDVVINRVVFTKTNAENIPFTFNGDTSITVKGSKYGVIKVRTDELGINISKGDVYSIIVHVTVASGAKYPLTIIARRGNYEEGSSGSVTAAGPAVDATGFGTAWTPTVGVIRMFMVSAILTKPAVLTRVPLFVTDSIGVGTGESTAPSNAKWDEGWCTRAVRNKWPHYIVGLSGTTAQRWTDSYINSFRRKSVMSGIYHTDVIYELGVNDFQGGANLATVQSRWIAAWKELSRSGRNIWQTTITPAVITSTDIFTTVAGQTANAQASVIASANDWLRDGAPINKATGLAVSTGTEGEDIVRANRYYTKINSVADKTIFSNNIGHPLTGIFEVADAIETSRNSGIVKVNFGARVLTNGAIASASTSFASSTGNFTSADIGRNIAIIGAGAAGPLITSITGITSSTQVTLAAAASATVSNATTYVSPYGGMADGVHPSGSAVDKGGHELISDFVTTQFEAEFGSFSS